jgi:hypothetical protein
VLGLVRSNGENGVDWELSKVVKRYGKKFDGDGGVVWM